MGWGVAVGSGGCGAVLRQRWDYLASCVHLPRHYYHPQCGRRPTEQNTLVEFLWNETLLDDRDERAGVNLKMQT